MQNEPVLVLREQLPLGRPYVAPRSPTEQRLCAIWCAALSMDRIGVDDNYIDLGGDSFLAAAIFAAMERSMGVRLPLATLVEAPTIAELAVRVDDPLTTEGLKRDVE